MSENSVAALAFICIFGAPAGAFVVMRILAHRERMEMIRRGMLPSSAAFRYKNVDFNANAASPPGAPTWTPGPADSDSPDRALRKGIMLALVGLAILIGLSFIGSDTDGPMNSLEIHPGPWLLGGLIPMFVGIAQIIVAVLSGARLGPIRNSAAPPPYSEPGIPRPNRAPYEPEPRTHSGYDELRRPTPPPERR